MCRDKLPSPSAGEVEICTNCPLPACNDEDPRCPWANSQYARSLGRSLYRSRYLTDPARAALRKAQSVRYYARHRAERVEWQREYRRKKREPALG